MPTAPVPWIFALLLPSNVLRTIVTVRGPKRHMLTVTQEGTMENTGLDNAQVRSRGWQKGKQQKCRVDTP